MRGAGRGFIYDRRRFTHHRAGCRRDLVMVRIKIFGQSPAGLNGHIGHGNPRGRNFHITKTIHGGPGDDLPCNGTRGAISVDLPLSPLARPSALAI